MALSSVPGGALQKSLCEMNATTTGVFVPVLEEIRENDVA